MGVFDVALKPVAAACAEAIETAALVRAEEAMKVRTPGGVFTVRWDEGGSATAMGQLAFFGEYLEATGLFERWVESCPLKYTSPNAPEVVDVLGTWMLSILDGHCRYAHVGMLRGDGVAPGILGMNKIIGDDSLRRALATIAPAPNVKHTSEQKAAQEAQLARGAVDEGAALAQHRAGRSDGVDTGLRHDDQDAVRQAGGGGGELQPAQEGAAQPCHPRLLDCQPTPGTGCPTGAWQPAYPRAWQARSAGAAGGPATGTSADLGTW